MDVDAGRLALEGKAVGSAPLPGLRLNANSGQGAPLVPATFRLSNHALQHSSIKAQGAHERQAPCLRLYLIGNDCE